MKFALTLMLCLALAMPSLASAQQFFDFDGQATLPTAVGGPLTMVGVVLDGSPATSTPIPLEFANFEYTIVLSGATLFSDGPTQTYSGGTLTIYEDNGTAADFGTAATFSDGTAILSGSLNALSRSVLIGTIGTVLGSVDWTGGSRIGDIALADRLNWPLLSGTNGGGAMAGYDEQWDGKVEPREPIVATEVPSWGELKSVW